MNSLELRKAIRAVYAWPGGYPTALMMLDGECLCMKCARKEYRLVARANRDRAERDWVPVAVFINWEDPELFCAHCNDRIPSAYADPEDDGG